MSTLVAIRTHVWNADAQRLHARLAPVLGDRLVTVFHNRRGLDLPLPSVDLDDGWPASQGLTETADWGWRCGDYFLYALRAARPGHEFYWLIEPDVHFTSSPEGFFAAFDAAQEDILGYEAGPWQDQGRFAQGLPDGMEAMRATFALTRISGRAIDFLLDRRRAISLDVANHRHLPNDEVFCWSTLNAEPGFTTARLETYAPAWFEGTGIHPSPDLLLDAVRDTVPAGRVLHPVRDRDSWLRALAGRLVDSASFLHRSKGVFAYFSDEELDHLSAMVGLRLRRTLREMQNSRAARRQRALRDAGPDQGEAE